MHGAWSQRLSKATGRPAVKGQCYVTLHFIRVKRSLYYMDVGLTEPLSKLSTKCYFDVDTTSRLSMHATVFRCEVNAE